jgi:hypothetical protein
MFLESRELRLAASGEDRTYSREASVGTWVVPEALEVQNKMIFMGHQISSCHVLVVRSFFILWKMLLSSQMFHMVTF